MILLWKFLGGECMFNHDFQCKTNDCVDFTNAYIFCKKLQVLTLCFSRLVQVFEASEFAPHPLYSVTQGGLDLQQVTG